MSHDKTCLLLNHEEVGGNAAQKYAWPDALSDCRGEPSFSRALASLLQEQDFLERM